MPAEAFAFDPFTLDHVADPTPAYRHLLLHAPVYWWERGQAWLVSRYRDAAALMLDPRLSRNVRDARRHRPLPDGPEYADFRAAAESGLFMASMADHLRLRRLVNPAFTPRGVEWLAPHIQALTEAALAGLPDAEVVDLAPVFDELPLRVISRMLAIPPDREPAFVAHARARVELLGPALPPARRDELIRGLAPGFADLRALIAERRARPGDDLLSTLAQRREDGARLSDDELLGMIQAIVVAGSETIAHALRFLLLDLLQHPDALARVRRDPGLARVAADESLRFDNHNLLGSPTYAREDVELRGVRIERGSTVIPLLGAAGRDPEVFRRPDRFDLDRLHLEDARLYGSGPHICLGIHLARLEVEVVLRTLLARHLDLVLAGPPTYAVHPFFRVMTGLPVSLRA
jgi:cytochrome P450